MPPPVFPRVGSEGPLTRSRSLGLRLFVLLFGVVLVAFAIMTWLNLRATAAEWTQFLAQCANRSSELIREATYYGMLLNRKEDVHETIRRIAERPGVSGVRIYDKQGTIIFSTEPGEVDRRVDLQAEACVICHDGGAPLRSLPTEERLRIYRGPGGDRILGVITPIPNQPECAQPRCHPPPSEKSVLGVLDVMMTAGQADARLHAAQMKMTLSTILVALGIGSLSGVFIHRVVRRPVKRLIAGTRRIAAGDLEYRLAVRSRDELGQLAESFNTMTEELARARAELTEWSDRLERKVVEKTEELGRAQGEMIHMEKMASLGKLAATVAHELNNPLSGILTYAKLVARCLDSVAVEGADRAEIRRHLELIQKESGRCGNIVRNLLTFAKRTGGTFAPNRAAPIVERALTLVRHHLEMASVRLEKRLDARDDEIVCDADQLGQALVALFVNGVEAMPSGGTLTVALRPAEDGIAIEISDTGPGIPADVLPHIFEPFFSTKDGASGVGLGLAVVYGIVRRHRGRIDVESRPGEGTKFRVRLPSDPGLETDEDDTENEP